MDTVVIMVSDAESDPELTGPVVSVRPREKETTARDDVIVLSEEEVYCTTLKSPTEVAIKRRLSERVESPRIKRPALEVDSATDDSEEDRPAPSWRDQERMVRRLQLAFPDLLKEELRDVLLSHDWHFKPTLDALPDISAEKARTTVTHPAPPPVSSKAPPLSVAPPTSHTTASSPGRPVGSSAGSSDGGGSSDGDFDQSDEHMEQLDSEEEEEAGPKRSGEGEVREQILRFFQEACVEELSLINGCSAKKAQKILELRPFNSWHQLMEAFCSGSGLSEDLLAGCRVVLGERGVVQRLMVRCQKISQKMVKELKQVEERSHRDATPRLLNDKFQLKPYQLIGLTWLRLLHQHQLSGILADEMGLGKTIQAISLLASLYEEGTTGPHLIIVPASTLDNWVREFNLWCPSLKVLVYHGSMETRKSLRKDILWKRVEYNVVISTYALTTGSDDRGLFQKLSLEYAVFDEGHMLKNMNTLRYRHLMAINARHRLLLTGTPLQNNLLELMSLLNFIMPQLLASCSAKLHKMFSMKSSREKNSFEMERIAQAKLIIKPFMLRRVKSEVLSDLPAKEVIVEFCPMSERQKELYDALLQRLRGPTNGEKRELTNVMMQLRKMANHPLLHRQHYTLPHLAAMSQLLIQQPSHCEANPALIQEDMEVMSDFQLHQMCLVHPCLQHCVLTAQLLLDSGKFSLLTQLLATIKHRDERVVLFSQFTRMLDILEVFLSLNHHRYIRLDGSTPVADRMGLIDEFNTQPAILVFLLSTKAGGLGINLTSANVVILHDMDYNPYNDKQAEDRCHRLGQTRVVRVIKLVSQDSIEETILNMGKNKLQLEQDMTATQDGSEDSIPDDMAALLKTSLGL